MVKKLFKYEFIYYIRTLGIFLPIVPILGVMTKIFSCFDTSNPFIMLAVIFSGLFCYLGALALLITTSIVGIVRFYKNMYSSEGYLTFTLPVTNAQHITVKLLTLAAFEALAMVSIIIAALIALSGEPLTIIFNGISAFAASIPAVHGAFYIIEAVLLLTASALASPLLYYTCITIGQTAKKNRILLAVGVYFIYYAVTQVLTTIAMIIFSVFLALGAFDGIALWIASNGYAFAHIVLIGITLFILGLAAVYYFITKRIMTRKLNLE